MSGKEWRKRKALRNLAARVGCSQMHVSRLLRGTLERMREDVARVRCVRPGNRSR
jgi:hypothetical protein